MLRTVKDRRLDDIAMICLILAKWWQDLVLHSTLRPFRRTKENSTPISCKIQLVFLIAKKIFDKNTLNYKLS